MKTWAHRAFPALWTIMGPWQGSPHQVFKPFPSHLTCRHPGTIAGMLLPDAVPCASNSWKPKAPLWLPMFRDLVHRNPLTMLEGHGPSGRIGPFKQVPVSNLHKMGKMYTKLLPCDFPHQGPVFPPPSQPNTPPPIQTAPVWSWRGVPALAMLAFWMCSAVPPCIPV